MKANAGALLNQVNTTRMKANAGALLNQLKRSKSLAAPSTPGRASSLDGGAFPSTLHKRVAAVVLAGIAAFMFLRICSRLCGACKGKCCGRSRQSHRFAPANNDSDMSSGEDSNDDHEALYTRRSPRQYTPARKAQADALTNVGSVVVLNANSDEGYSAGEEERITF